ncbi:MAG: hypothetical protein V1891_00145 [bacterium]
MKKKFEIILIFALLFCCCFIKSAAAEEYAITELTYSIVGGTVTIASEDLYNELLGEQNKINRPNFLSNLNLGKKFRNFIPVVKTATIITADNEYPAEITVSKSEPNVVILISEYLNFYNKAAFEFFPFDARIDELEKTITLTGVDFNGE